MIELTPSHHQRAGHDVTFWSFGANYNRYASFALHSKGLFTAAIAVATTLKHQPKVDTVSAQSLIMTTRDVSCGNGLLCSDGDVCCPNGGGCCPTGTPKCCSDGSGCCPTNFPVCCMDGCYPSGTNCCPGGGGCASTQFCCGNSCCLTNLQICDAGQCKWTSG